MKNKVLIVEDEKADFRIFEKTLSQLSSKITATLIENGKDFIQLFEDPHSDLPNLIFLDLNLPGMDGKELLSRLRTTKRWNLVPVIILSSSSYEQDVIDCYNLSANAYVTKPDDLPGYKQMIQETTSFWLKTVTLPFTKSS